MPALISIVHTLKKELNFFRIHLLCFVFIPLICAGIFVGSNGKYPVDFIDALFLCYSAMTVTGLTTSNVSSLTGWQQGMLWILMLVGNVVRVNLTH